MKAPTASEAAACSVTADELAQIERNAEAVGDRYTLAEVRRARAGDSTALLACAMILGR